jgi:hypothetical protein
MQTMTSDEIAYVVASFKAWCAAHDKPVASEEEALGFFTYVHNEAPALAELITDDWEDFIAFLQERRLLG